MSIQSSSSNKKSSFLEDFFLNQSLKFYYFKKWLLLYIDIFPRGLLKEPYRILAVHFSSLPFLISVLLILSRGFWNPEICPKVSLSKISIFFRFMPQCVLYTLHFFHLKKKTLLQLLSLWSLLYK